MLLVIMRGLDHAQDEDELRIWGSILMAFHFMLRSMDYCAKLEGGKFDLDNVLRVYICDLSFKQDGKVIRSNYTGRLMGCWQFWEEERAPKEAR